MKKQNLSFLLIALVTVAGLYFSLGSKSTDEVLFNEWKQKLGVEFQEHENVYRFNIFKENVARINAHNSRLNKGHEEGLNQFAFLTQEEFAAKYLSNIEKSNEEVVVE